VSVSAFMSAACVANASLNYRWEQVATLPSDVAVFSGITLSPEVITVPVLSVSSPNLYFPRFSFQADRRYAFRCTVTNSQGNSNAIVVAMDITAKPLVGSIAGGDRNVRVDRPLLLNASTSRDPDAPELGVTGMVFAWSCVRAVSQAACFSGSELSANTALITVPASSLSVSSGDSYVFSVIVTKGSRTASARVTIDISALPVPAVSIMPIPAFFTLDSRVVLRGNAVPTGTRPVFNGCVSRPRRLTSLFACLTQPQTSLWRCDGCVTLKMST